jgi:hypothetical protein
LDNPTGTAEINWVQIKTYAFLERLEDNAAVHRGRFYSIPLKKTIMKKIIPSPQVQHKVHIVHDCFDGYCNVVDGNHIFMEEREVVQHNIFVFIHNCTNNRYLLNPFYLGNDAFNFVEPCEDL